MPSFAGAAPAAAVPSAGGRRRREGCPRAVPAATRRFCGKRGAQLSPGHPPAALGPAAESPGLGVASRGRRPPKARALRAADPAPRGGAAEPPLSGTAGGSRPPAAARTCRHRSARRRPLPAACRPARPRGYLPRAWWRRRWAARGCPWGCRSAPAWPPSRGAALWHRGCRCLCRGCPAGRGSHSSAPCSETRLPQAGRSRRSTDLEARKTGGASAAAGPRRRPPPGPARPEPPQRVPRVAPFSAAGRAPAGLGNAPLPPPEPAPAESVAVRPRRPRPAALTARPAGPGTCPGGDRQRCAPVPIAPGRPGGSSPAHHSQVLRPGPGLGRGPPPGAAGKRLPLRADPLARPPRAGQLWQSRSIWLPARNPLASGSRELLLYLLLIACL